MQKRSCEKRAWALARLAVIALAALVSASGRAQMSTTTVQGTIYRADGTPASGTLLISWPAFTTAQNQAVAAGSLNAAIGGNGFVSVNLTPNAGALPTGSYYTATYHLNDGTVNTEFWVVPAAGTATVGAVRAQLQPATVAVQSAVTANYVQGAISSLSGTYMPLAGGTMTGALTLSGDPVASFQAASKHYADQLAAQNLPLSGGALTGPLTAPSISAKQLEGRLFADQAQTTAGNNGIAMSLSQCRSLPYACQVVAPALYAQTEAQPFGGIVTWPTLGPKSSDPVAQFEDERWGVPQWIFNSSQTTSNHAYASPNMVMNYTGYPATTSTSVGLPVALSLQMNAWATDHDFYNDKSNANTLTANGYYYGDTQNEGINAFFTNFGNGDLAGISLDSFNFGGCSTQGCEGNEAFRVENGQAGTVFGATVASVSVGTDGSTTIGTSAQVANGSQGTGRIVIDLTKVYNAGYISAIGADGNGYATCSGCSWDSTFGLSTKTTLAAAVQNPVSGTNSFPQSNTVLSVASSSGFSVGNLACIWDYDYECEKVTAVGTGTVTIATDRKPHPSGAYVTTGGLSGYAIEFEADRVVPGNTNGVGTMPDAPVQQTIRFAIPVMYNVSGNKLYFFNGFDALPGTVQNNAYQGRAYPAMSGSGATCSTTISGGAVTAINITGGGSGYHFGNNGEAWYPQIVLTGSWSSAPWGYVTWVNNSNQVQAAAVGGGGSGVTSASCSVVTENPYDLYPAAKTYSVYNQTAGSVDGTLYTQPWPVVPAASDAIEQPHYFSMATGGFGNQAIGQYFPEVSSIASEGTHTYFNGVYASGPNSALEYTNSTDPTLYQGYPFSGKVNIIGRSTLNPAIFGRIEGPWQKGWYMDTPPFAENSGWNPAAFYVDCGTLGCSSWNVPYWLVAGNTVNGAAGIQINPSTGTVSQIAPGADTSCSTTLAGGSGNGGLSVSCGSHTSKFDAAGNLSVPGTVTAGAVTGATIDGELTVDGAIYGTLNAAWNAAAAKAASSGQDQTVRLGPGTYPVSATLSEPTNGACVNLVGSAGTTMNADSAQVATTLTVPNALNGDMIALGNTSQAQGCTFKDLNIVASGNATHGFELEWFRGLLIENVTVNDTTGDGIVLGEEDTSAGHESSFLLRNVTVSYSAATFAPATRPAYGIHLEKTAMDSHLDDVVVRNALVAAVYNEGTGNTGTLIHGFGYPYTCTTGPCANTASSGSAANASYATNYVIYDMGGGGSVWTDTYMDSPAMAGFYIGANGVEIHGGHIQWPDVTSFPSANLAYVAANVSNNLLIADVDCLEMAPGVNWITYAGASGNPPTYASVHHLTGCGNYYQSLEPANTTGFSSGGANINDPSGAVPRVWSTPIASAASYPAYSAQMYTGYQGDAFQAHFSGAAPFFNITYQGTIRTNGGIALSTVTNTASTLTLTAANKNVIANASSGPQTITLPSCYTQLPDRTAPTGLEFTIIKSDTSSNAVTLATTSSQLIYSQGVGAATLVLSGPATQTLVCGPDNNWYVAGSTAPSTSTPHMTWYGSFAGTFGTSTNTSLGAIWTPSAGVSMTRLDIAVGTAPAGCTTYPKIGVYDSTAAAWLKTVMLASGTYSYRNAVTGVAVPAGHNLSMGVQTAGAGCTTNAGSAQLTMEYVMQ